jgi:predicted solute-binding protein
VLKDSCLCGLGALDRIIEEEAAGRTMPLGMVEHYLRNNIVFQHGDAERAGLELYLRYAREMNDLVLAEDPLHGDSKS